MLDYEILAPTGDICGEGAVWDPDTSVVYWCDINQFLIHRFDPSFQQRAVGFEEPVVALSPQLNPADFWSRLAQSSFGGGQKPISGKIMV